MSAHLPRFGALLLCAWIVAAAPAAAQSSPASAASAGSAPSGPPPGGRPPGPPPEAVQACAGKDAGTACSFSGREGRTLAGTCAAGKAPPGAGTSASADSGATGTSSAAATLACHPAQPPGNAGPGARQQQ